MKSDHITNKDGKMAQAKASSSDAAREYKPSKTEREIKNEELHKEVVAAIKKI